ncbi:MAG: SufD family Fe-S cluster assembly protein [Candidatus Cryptobacteroides sp.]
MNRKKTDHGNYVAAPPCGGVRIGEGTSVRKLYVLRDKEDGLPPQCFTVEAGSRLDLTVIALPGVSAGIPLDIDIVGEGAEVNLSGIFLSSGEDKVDFNITMIHRVGGCRSSQLFNGVAAGDARCSFSGTIVVAPDARQTEAFQTNHNIILGESARVETTPRLEIYADDVKCSHGATVGRLNEEERYYMQTRGIPEDEARILQMISFVAPVLAGLPQEDGSGNPCREEVSRMVEEAIRAI